MAPWRTSWRYSEIPILGRSAEHSSSKGFTPDYSMSFGVWSLQYTLIGCSSISDQRSNTGWASLVYSRIQTSCSTSLSCFLVLVCIADLFTSSFVVLSKVDLLAPLLLCPIDFLFSIFEFIVFSIKYKLAFNSFYNHRCWSTLSALFSGVQTRILCLGSIRLLLSYY